MLKVKTLSAEIMAMESTPESKLSARKENREIAIQLLELFADDWEDFYRLKLLLRDALERCCCAFLKGSAKTFEAIQDEDLKTAQDKLDKIADTTAMMMSGMGMNTLTMQLYFTKKAETEDTPEEIVIPFGKAMTLSLLIDGAYDELHRKEIIQTDFVIAKAQIQHKIEQTENFNVFDVFAAQVKEEEFAKLTDDTE